MAGRGPLKIGYRLASRASRALGRLRQRSAVFAEAELADRLARAAVSATDEDLDEIVADNLRAHGAAVFAAHATRATAALDREKRLRGRRFLFKATLAALMPADADAALAYAEAFVDQVDDPRTSVRVARLLAGRGAIVRPLALLERHGKDALDPLVRQLREQVELLEHGPVFSAVATAGEPPDPRRVVFVVDDAMPLHATALARAVHDLLRGLASRGWQVSALVRFGYPDDRPDAGRPTERAREELDGVTYDLDPDALGERMSEKLYLTTFSQRLARRAAPLHPALIHAVGDHRVAVAAVAAARAIGAGSIVQLVPRAPLGATDHDRLVQRLELAATGAADHVVVATTADTATAVDALEGLYTRLIAAVSAPPT